ncbi:uncharacterized protein BP5553_10127 [Venustampulla echinocandica]|uniref:F-box domain-containing protein n=1 Tax=Venustampulla echinocandica TaxID=2656787 RepID=A0A370TAF9_9HELO|nr:uncharacterized protein BP5553_10127 [Venustampulla echinocandica]RDL30782.1 hypothetical protein BP5553_10127 [Venustampulla echinocandica]
MEQPEMPSPAQNDAARVEIPTSPVSVKTLLDLPPELILQIIEFLPTISIASFALCNKRSAAQLGSRAWNLLSNLESDDRIHFLTILSRDLPRHHACHGSFRLHLSSSIPQPANLNAPPEPDSCIPAYARNSHFIDDGFVRIPLYFSPYKLRFHHVQLALKQHHYGFGHGIPLSDLSHNDITLTRRSVCLFSVDARIASNELVMRSQEWVLLSQRPVEHFLSESQGYGVCRHMTTRNEGTDLDGRLTTLIRCQLGHGAADDDCACMGLHRCFSCPMEYQIDVVDFKERGTAICATKWLNLGAGLTTRDSNWRGHNLLPRGYVPHNLPLGSIRSSYESQEGAPIDELTAENKKRLFYLPMIGRKVYMSMGYCDWKLVGQDIWYSRRPEVLNIIQSLCYRLLDLVSRTVLQFTEVLF